MHSGLGMLFIVRQFLHFLSVVFSLESFFFYVGHIEYEYFSNWSILPMDRTLKGTTPPGQSEPWSSGNEKVLHTPQISRTGASQSNAI